MIEFWRAASFVFVGEIALGLVLTILPRLGGVGRLLAERCRRTPSLDLLLTLMLWVPWIAGAWILGWSGLGAALLAQVVAVYTWITAHELVHRAAVRGPRIVRAHNRIVGRWRNHLGLWVTVAVFPVLSMIRVSEVLFYPFVVWLIGFPRYRQADWVNVSRDKFAGLVGHDLIWCLYCDWMTGVYALGAEMIRNVESFWCPIRFSDKAKCANCAVDFPDLVRGWVPADGTMAEVEDTIMRMYTGRERSWFGHPARLTIKGADVEEPRQN